MDDPTTVRVNSDLIKPVFCVRGKANFVALPRKELDKCLWGFVFGYTIRPTVASHIGPKTKSVDVRCPSDTVIAPILTALLGVIVWPAKVG